jgi:hypothetical protein
MARASELVEIVLTGSGWLIGERLLAQFYDLPDILLYDAQRGDVLDHPIRLRVGARDALAGVRMLDIA